MSFWTMYLTCFISFKEDSGQIDFFPEKRPLDVWDGAVLPCDVALTPKIYGFCS